MGWRLGDTAGGLPLWGLVWKECIYVNVHVFRSRKLLGIPLPRVNMSWVVVGGGSAVFGCLPRNSSSKFQPTDLVGSLSPSILFSGTSSCRAGVRTPSTPACALQPQDA